MDQPTKIKSILFLILCASCWGPSYLFIKLAVGQISPLTLVFLRVAIAFLILLLFCLWQKENVWKWKQYWKHFIVLGITLHALPFYLVNYGELFISSSLTGILNSFTLIFTAIFAHFFGPHVPLTKNKLIGILLGLVGLTVIYLPLVLQKGVEDEFGALLIILACLSYGIGTVYARTYLKKIPSRVVLTAQLGMATAILLPLIIFWDRPYTLPFPSAQAIFAAIFLGAVGTAAGFACYYKVIQLAGATYASFAVLLIPVIAMALGFFVLHEQLTWNLYLGTFFILAGLLTMNPPFKRKM